jgi:enoyl-CoA hydratase/carnithine racemase
MPYETVLLDLRDSVATITLNRPEKLNALNYQLVSDLDAALTQLEADDGVRVIIVTGAGRAFCAGADLTGVSPGEASQMGSLLKRMIRPWNMTKPVIAAINGPAVGGGITIPMMFDIRIAAESARMGFVFTRRAAVPELFSTFFLPRQIGLAKASDLLLSGRIFGAQEALQLGIVSQVWPDAELRQRVWAFAVDIAQNTAPISVAMTKRLIHLQLSEHSPERADDLEVKAMNYVRALPDISEGAKAFIEKRAPKWKGEPSRDMPDFLPPLK